MPPPNPFTDLDQAAGAPTRRKTPIRARWPLWLAVVALAVTAGGVVALAVHSYARTAADDADAKRLAVIDELLKDRYEKPARYIFDREAHGESPTPREAEVVKTWSELVYERKQILDRHPTWKR